MYVLLHKNHERKFYLKAIRIIRFKNIDGEIKGRKRR